MNMLSHVIICQYVEIRKQPFMSKMKICVKKSFQEYISVINTSGILVTQDILKKWKIKSKIISNKQLGVITQTKTEKKYFLNIDINICNSKSSIFC